MVEKKVFPARRPAATASPPASVRQLADMGLEGALAGAHRYTGLRAHAFGQVLDLPLARAPALPLLRLRDHPPRPRRPGHRAGRQGRGHVWQGTEAVEPILDDGAPTAGPGAGLPPCSGPWSRRRPPGPPARCGPATWWWPTGPTRASAGPSARPRPRDLPMGMALRGYYALARPRRPLHRVPPRHPRRRRRGGARLRVDLPAGRRPGERRRRPALDRPAVEGRQHLHADGRLRGLRAAGAGSCRPRPASVRRPGASSRWAWRSARGWVHNPGGRATLPASINPFNGEGIAYGYETGRLGRGVASARPWPAAAHAAARRLRGAGSRTPTASTTGWPGPSSG